MESWGHDVEGMAAVCVSRVPDGTVGFGWVALALGRCHRSNDIRYDSPWLRRRHFVVQALRGGMFLWMLGVGSGCDVLGGYRWNDPDFRCPTCESDGCVETVESVQLEVGRDDCWLKPRGCVRVVGVATPEVSTHG